MVSKKKNPVEEIQRLTEELLAKMGVEAKVAVEEDKKNKMFKISLSSPQDNALLVGRFGRNLEALQTILNLMVANALGEWQRVLVDIDGYRQKREEQLEKMAQEALEKVAATGEPVTFPGLSSFERRVIHLYFKDKPEMETLSEGEGRDRYLVVRRRQGEE